MIGDAPKTPPPAPPAEFLIRTMSVSIRDPKTKKLHHVGELELSDAGVWEIDLSHADWIFAAYELEDLAAFLKRCTE